MIGQSITSEDGNPLPQYQKLSPSPYTPNDDVKKLFERCQRDYQIAYHLQHRTFDEFDGYSLLQRTKLDQQLFGTYVGAQYVPEHKKWRWRGRTTTARNKLVGILAHMISGMLFPIVYAHNEQNEEDKATARVMSILIEDHLKKANYELKFLYFVLSALVNPAVFVEVEYLVAFQKVKEQLADGTVNITEAVDSLLSGLSLNIIPIDQILLADFYTSDIQMQPYLVRIQRIPWDTARKIWGQHKDFKYVEAGKTRVFLSGQESGTLYDVAWTEGDRTQVQVITLSYRDEDAEFTWVGGVFVGDDTDVYNKNPFKHRRMTLLNDEWHSIPVYKYAKSGFEPIDPTGRFAYYKSGAFKQFWDDDTQNQLRRLRIDAAKLEAIKPLFISGVSKVDGMVIAPGAVTGMPANAQINKYDLAANFAALVDLDSKQEDDMSNSTIANILEGQIGPRMTAFAYNAILTNAKILFGVFGVMFADLLKQVGGLTVDVVIQHATIGELDATIPEALGMKYKTFLARTKDNGRQITHRIVFTDKFMGKLMSPKEREDAEWQLFYQTGADFSSDQRVWEVNPYRLARTSYTTFIDVDKMVMRTMDLSRQEKDNAFAHLTNPVVAPYVDMQAVINDFVIEPYGGDDPEKYKAKQGVMNGMMNAAINMQGQEGAQSPQNGQGVVTPSLTGIMNPTIQ